MGFCYQMSGGRKLLCCDVCGTAGGVRKQRCPAGYCPAVAVCPACRAKPETMARLRAYHVDNDCAGASARFAAAEAAVATAQANGAHTFCASVYDDSTRQTVRCWFRNAAGDEKEAVVTNAVRDTLTRTSTYEALAREARCT